VTGAVLGPDLVLSLLAGAVAAARAAGATDAEASYEAASFGATRFAGSRFTQAGAIVEGRVRVRAAVGDRVGAASTSTIDAPDGLADAARLAVTIARHRRPVPGFTGFATPAAQTAPALATRYFDATAAATPSERAERLARIFARAARDHLTCAGSFVTSPVELAVVTSGGVAVHALGSEALLELIAQDDGGGLAAPSGYAVFYGPDLAALDEAALADEACRTAVAARNPTALPAAAAGPLDAVLAPAAVAEALEWMAITGFSGRALLDGASLLAGRHGQPLCAREVTIRDDAAHPHPRALPLPFDSEGTTRQRVTFIDRGLGGRVVTDQGTARKLQGLGLEPGRGPSTGHAAPVTDEMADGPVPMHLVLEPGDASAADLVARVERGLYVTRFHYVNGYLDPRRAAMTGMTRDGTFLIEDGRLGRAVPNVRWTEGWLAALAAGRLGGLGRDLACIPSRWSNASGTVLCPALLVRRFGFALTPDR
jgi:PmbA protein